MNTDNLIRLLNYLLVFVRLTEPVYSPEIGGSCRGMIDTAVGAEKVYSAQCPYFNSLTNISLKNTDVP